MILSCIKRVLFFNSRFGEIIILALVNAYIGLKFSSTPFLGKDCCAYIHLDKKVSIKKA